MNGATLSALIMRPFTQPASATGEHAATERQLDWSALFEDEGQHGGAQGDGGAGGEIDAAGDDDHGHSQGAHDDRAPTRRASFARFAAT